MAKAASPATPSCSATRRQQRRANYLTGRARSAYRLRHSLEAGLLEGSSTSSSTSSSSSISCKKGCTQALAELKEAFHSAGQHPLKDQQKRVSSYPVTKKYKPAYRNMRGNAYNNNNNNNNTTKIKLQDKTNGYDRT